MTTAALLTSNEELDDVLAAELAELAQRCIHGFSDNRPVSVTLVRSRLTNALTGEPPLLVTARRHGMLVGWCAVRSPEPGEVRARLWGPVVDPSMRRTGLGKRLLGTTVESVRGSLRSTDVPTDRAGAADFFTSEGWFELNRTTVLQGSPVRQAVETASGADYPDPRELDHLVATAARRFGGHPPQFAASTLTRWRSDARFRPENLLVEPLTGSLLLALAQRNLDTSELLLAELWAEPQAQQPLVRSAQAIADRLGLARIRAVTDGDPGPFLADGLRTTGICQTFALDR
ncbi:MULTISPECIES: GNAT family N-acetyltransferase [Kitasatospora]|jgi:hypothetical protein|uniref:GNAT family N-acetyltransferase n=1 Tax=Kitasatospora TaxID=2063 RepID=UPI000C713ACF|nr:GNAT family N-acetyltransferase [Kitasatospora sp. GP30]MDH6145854.1 hypothetical protein [Kitasatospora sp. GP30]